MHPLHPTLQLLKWDYGALDENQEKDYIRAKMDIVVRTAGKAVADNFTATTNDGKIEEVAMDEVEVSGVTAMHGVGRLFEVRIL